MLMLLCRSATRSRCCVAPEAADALLCFAAEAAADYAISDNAPLLMTPPFYAAI